MPLQGLRHRAEDVVVSMLGSPDDDDHGGAGPVAYTLLSEIYLTPGGEQHLKVAAQAVRDRLAERLTGWDDGDIATFAQLVTRFNQSRG